MNIINNRTHLEKQIALAKHRVKQYENLIDTSTHTTSISDQLTECKTAINHKKSFMDKAKFEEKTKLQAQLELLEIREKALETAIKKANNGKNIEVLVRELNVGRSNVKSLQDRLDRLNHKNPNLKEQAMDTIVINQNYLNK